MDAAIAVAAALTVLEPTSCGLGSDAFALVWEDGVLTGLNASGAAPAMAHADALRRDGLTEMPALGWPAVTVPGAVSAWSRLHDRFGCLPFRELLEPAIQYAREGAPVPPVIAGYWKAAERRFKGKGGVFEEFERVFLPGGRAPAAGEVFRSEDMACTLESVAFTHGESFYRGAIARAIAEHSEETGGLLRIDDLERHEPEWVDPISVGYRGYRIHEIPPNGQGIVALMALGILEGFDMSSMDQLGPESLHLIAEALRLSFADAHAYVGDPRLASIPVKGLLDPDYLALRRGQILEGRAMVSPKPGLPGSARWQSHDGDTVYLATADSQGMMVSFIQSNYMGFGSGVVIPGTGISMQNRGAGFSLRPGSPNELAPFRRPFHTIIPGFITKDGEACAAFGVMGGDMQPQGHVQVVSAVLDHGQNPQAAIDCPRIRVLGPDRVAVEVSVPESSVKALAEMGHAVYVEPERAGFGGGQMIWRSSSTGVLIAGSEPRKDGYAAAL
ncbi:MAG: putative gamma-glutamyltransferase YwrD [Firmicutes bacterium ADurb.Bin506]|nr:MAG: putative gamma-glutamyltransferase YwrD [Firmicutes bacterium ADurb.Bin506]